MIDALPIWHTQLFVELPQRGLPVVVEAFNWDDFYGAPELIWWRVDDRLFSTNLLGGGLYTRRRNDDGSVFANVALTSSIIVAPHTERAVKALISKLIEAPAHGWSVPRPAAQ